MEDKLKVVGATLLNVRDGVSTISLLFVKFGLVLG